MHFPDYRVLERLGLEGTLKTIQFQPLLCAGWKHSSQWNFFFFLKIHFNWEWQRTMLRTDENELKRKGTQWIFTTTGKNHILNWWLLKQIWVKSSTLCPSYHHGWYTVPIRVLHPWDEIRLGNKCAVHWNRFCPQMLGGTSHDMMDFGCDYRNAGISRSRP